MHDQNVIERTCKGCGEWSLCFDGYCGECASAVSVDAYVAWYNSPAGVAHRLLTAEQVLSELALDQADELPQVTGGE